MIVTDIVQGGCYQMESSLIPKDTFYTFTCRPTYPRPLDPADLSNSWTYAGPRHELHIRHCRYTNSGKVVFLHFLADQNHYKPHMQSD